jgi:hypothetical protein
MLQSSSELHRYELYKSSGTGSDGSLEFAGLINHSLMVHKAEDVTAGVDSALEQLRSNMAAISDFKEANKYASPVSHSCPRCLASSRETRAPPSHMIAMRISSCVYQD